MKRFIGSHNSEAPKYTAIKTFFLGMAVMAIIALVLYMIQDKRWFAVKKAVLNPQAVNAVEFRSTVSVKK